MGTFNAFNGLTACKSVQFNGRDCYLETGRDGIESITYIPPTKNCPPHVEITFKKFPNRLIYDIDEVEAL